MVTGFLMLAIVMVVNVQIGLNDGNSTDIGLFGITTNVFVPSATATIECNKHCGSWDACFDGDPNTESGWTNCDENPYGGCDVYGAFC